MKERHQADSLSYIDDFGAVTSPNHRKANTQYFYVHLKNLIVDLDMTLAVDKCAPASTVMSWIGTTYDTINMCMFIDEEKIKKLLISVN